MTQQETDAKIAATPMALVQHMRGTIAMGNEPRHWDTDKVVALLERAEAGGEVTDHGLGNHTTADGYMRLSRWAAHQAAELMELGMRTIKGSRGEDIANRAEYGCAIRALRAHSDRGPDGNH